MSYINKYLRNFRPYEVASHKVWQVDADERNKMLKLDWNEATISPSPKVIERIRHLISSDFMNLYPATYNEELHELLAEYAQLPKENVQYFASSDSLHEYIAKMYITVGDPALILWPSYDNFRLTAQVAGANVTFFELGKEFELDYSKFEESINKNEPSLVYICNPNNPTGLLISKEYIKRLLEMFPATMFLIDEAYIEFTIEETCKELVLDYDNILISRTMSKAFGLANVRFGYLLASEENVRFISSIRNPKNITTFTQEAVIGALEDVEYMWKYVEEVNEAKIFFVDAINNRYGEYLCAHQSSANFVLIKCNSQKVKSDLLDYLVSHNIYVRNTNHSVSVKKCIRITIGLMEQTKQVIRVIGEFYDEQNG